MTVASGRTGPTSGDAAVREGQTYRGESLAARFASLVKLPHTLFALPFAGVGAVLASYGHAQQVTIEAIAWIVMAFTAARFAAMAFNRIIDRRLDALNPRTRARELPSGRVTVAQAAVGVVIASALFVLAAWRLNPLCGALAPVALAWVFFYSYTKRFTALSHHVLGFALGIAPVGAYLAIAGGWTDPWYALPVLAAAVAFWVAGFDVIYAVQDIAFDRDHGLHSLASRLGAARALTAARVFHLVALVLFFSLWALRLFPLGWIYLGGMCSTALLLAYEHWVVRDAARGTPDLSRIDRAFFRANVAVSLSLLVFTLADRLLAGGAALIATP
ncbi:MAG: UbiA-like polyprenyltransferase [Longimicrobiales bacterium]